MARYRVEEKPAGVAIHVTEVTGRQEELLGAFEECRSGHCTCPTDEYQKVDRMEIAVTDEGIEIDLRVKPGTLFDTDQISACLDHTTAKVHGSMS